MHEGPSGKQADQAYTLQLHMKQPDMTLWSSSNIGRRNTMLSWANTASWWINSMAKRRGSGLEQ